MLALIRKCAAPHFLTNVKLEEMWSWFPEVPQIATLDVPNSTFIRIKETPASRELCGLCSTACATGVEPA